MKIFPSFDEQPQVLSLLYGIAVFEIQALAVAVLLSAGAAGFAYTLVFLATVVAGTVVSVRYGFRAGEIVLAVFCFAFTPGYMLALIEIDEAEPRHTGRMILAGLILPQFVGIIARLSSAGLDALLYAAIVLAFQLFVAWPRRERAWAYS